MYQKREVECGAMQEKLRMKGIRSSNLIMPLHGGVNRNSLMLLIASPKREGVLDMRPIAPSL